MKLRIRGNSIRVRMDRNDLAELLDYGRTDSFIRFGLGQDQALSYAVRTGEASRGRPCVEYAAGCVLLTIDPLDVEEWVRSDNVGFNHEQIGEDGIVVRVLLEKDFACLDRPAGEEPDDAFAFPNPSAGVC
jgi:hypothetical protein